MSWSYSRALVAEYLDQCCLDIEPSALLNTMPTPDQFYWPDKTTEHSRLSRFGMTCVPLTESLGAELLIAYQAGFHAKTSAQPEKAQESKENEADCGKKWRGSFARYDRDTHSLKTAQCSLLEDSTLSCPTLPRWGLMQDGACFLAEMPAEFIYEKGCGLSLPTPRTCSAMQARITEKTANAKFPNLETVLAGLMLPTLGANENKGSSKNMYLNSPDFHGAKMSEALRTCESDPIYLNPLFGELVMMWPLGHTDLKPLETARFQEFVQQHGVF